MQQSSINPRIAALSPYKPGKPVDEVARELGINDIVKLASNENPRGPGEKVQQRLLKRRQNSRVTPMAAVYTKIAVGRENWR